MAAWRARDRLAPFQGPRLVAGPPPRQPRLAALLPRPAQRGAEDKGAGLTCAPGTVFWSSPLSAHLTLVPPSVAGLPGRGARRQDDDKM